MCSEEFSLVDSPNEFSVLTGACPHLGAHKRGTRVFFGILSPFADAVYLVGSFNDWRESDRLERNEFGVWQTSISADEIKDGDKYKFRAYFGDQVAYLTDPYAEENDGEPFFNSVYRERSAKEENIYQGGREDGCGIYPLNIYGINVSELFLKEGRAPDFTDLGNELIPYLLQMGYTHVSISGIPGGYGDACDNFNNDTDGEHSMLSFVRALHSSFIGAFADWNVIGSDEDGICDVEVCVRKALNIVDSLELDGFVIDSDDARGAEFFSELVHTVKSKRPGVSFIVRAAAGCDVSFADATVSECDAYRKLFRQRGDAEWRSRMNAASLSYLLFKEGRMLTRSGYERGCEHAIDTLRREAFEAEVNADLQFFCSELFDLYLSSPEVFGYGDSRAVSVEMDCCGIRVIKRCSDAYGFILAADPLGCGGDIRLPATGRWNILLDSTALLCRGSAAVRCDTDDEVYLSLPPYGAVILERID